MYFPRFPRETLDFRIETKEEDEPTTSPHETNLGENEVLDIEAAKKPLENSLRDNENLLKKLQSTKKAAIELGAADILKEVQKFEIQVEENIKSIDKILNGL